MSSRRQVLLFTVFAQVFFISACGSNSTAQISGSLMHVGGPAGSQPGPSSGEVRIYKDGKQIAKDDVASDEGGRFLIEVPPGEYEIDGYSGNVTCARTPLAVSDAGLADVMVECPWN
jgi:hypothetical protein